MNERECLTMRKKQTKVVNKGLNDARNIKLRAITKKRQGTDSEVSEEKISEIAMQARHNKELLEVLIRTVRERAQLRAQLISNRFSSELGPTTKRKRDNQQRCRHTEEEPPIKRIKVLDHDQPSSAGLRTRETYHQPNWLGFGNEWQNQATLPGCNLTGPADLSLASLLPCGSGTLSHQYDPLHGQSSCVEDGAMMPELEVFSEANGLPHHTQAVESSDLEHDLFIRLRSELGYVEDDSVYHI